MDHRFYEVARDGYRLAHLIPKRQLLLEPGARREVPRAGAGPGTYALRTAPFSTGPQGNHYLGAVLATLHVAGAAVTPIASPRTCSQSPIAGRSHGPPAPSCFPRPRTGTLFIDGRTFDPAAPIRASSSGRWEEWTVRNESGELHDFHIHQTHFQVTEVNGVPQPFRRVPGHRERSVHGR